MQSRTRFVIAVFAIVIAPLLSGCHRRAEDPSSVTVDEQAQLNDAAVMLDANSVLVGMNDTEAPDDEPENAS